MRLAAAVVCVVVAFWIGLNGLRMPRRPPKQFKLPVRQIPVVPVPSPIPKQLTPR
jgi:hypothetical protein